MRWTDQPCRRRDINRARRAAREVVAQVAAAPPGPALAWHEVGITGFLAAACGVDDGCECGDWCPPHGIERPAS